MFTIVGAGYAGRMAMARIRAREPDARITLIDPLAEAEDRIRFHQLAAGRDIEAIPLDALTRRLGIRHIRDSVSAREGLRLTLRGGSVHTAQQLILATGLPRLLPPGPAHSLRSRETALALHHALVAEPQARVTVIGAGFTAIETVTWLQHRFPRARFTVWRKEPVWNGLFSARGAALIDAYLARRQIRVIDGGRVETLTEDIAVSDEHQEAHDLAIWLVGAAPGGQLSVDPTLQHESGVFVAGDLAKTAHVTGCVTALPLGVHAGENAVRRARGRRLEPFRFRNTISFLSLGPTSGVTESIRDGRPGRLTIGGRSAALLKYLILGYVRTTLHIESRLWPVYRWPQPLRLDPS